MFLHFAAVAMRTFGFKRRPRAKRSSPAAQGLLPPSKPLFLLDTFETDAGVVATRVVAPDVQLQLKRVPALWGDSDAAICALKTKTREGSVDFEVRYRRDTAWHVDEVSQVSVLEHACDRYLEPDVSLTIRVSPAQEPLLWGENITALTWTPPLPPESEWCVTFYGAASAAPRVFARCGSQGPVERFELDNSEVRWSNNDVRDYFAFDLYYDDM